MLRVFKQQIFNRAASCTHNTKCSSMSYVHLLKTSTRSKIRGEFLFQFGDFNNDTQDLATIENCVQYFFFHRFSDSLSYMYHISQFQWSECQLNSCEFAIYLFNGGSPGTSRAITNNDALGICTTTLPPGSRILIILKIN